MQVEVTWQKVTAVLGTVVLIPTLIVVWKLIGWMTPDQHDADIVEVEATVATQQQAILNAISALELKADTRHEHWECDEMGEELADWLKVENPPESLLEDIRRRREAMTLRKCARFDDPD